MQIKDVKQIIKGINKWAEKAVKHRWIKVSYRQSEYGGFISSEEIAASIQSHIGLTSIIERNTKTWQLKSKKKQQLK